jgi:hypothetical protein
MGPSNVPIVSGDPPAPTGPNVIDLHERERARRAQLAASGRAAGAMMQEAMSAAHCGEYADFAPGTRFSRFDNRQN